MKRQGSLARVLVAVANVLLAASMLAQTGFAQEPCEPVSGGKECFVGPNGDDANPGTEAEPFATVARGVEELGPGDTLTLREGAYVQETQLDIRGVNGTADAPIVIRSFAGEHASIDGMIDAIEWVPADEPGAHADEYVSVQTFTTQVRGAFVDRDPYTRLVKYSNVNDFRADNETYEKIPCDAAPPEPCGDSDARPGPEVVLNCTLDDGSPCRYPWVYMGPGIWIDPEVSESNPQPVHVRLSPTHNDIDGLEDYAGPVDPNDVALAISSKEQPALSVAGSSHIRFEDLAIRFGGEPTVSLQSAATTNITFDHVRILASSFGVRSGQTSDVTFEHCELDGGKPPWLFRSDIKISYTYLENGAEIENRGANATMDDLMVPGGTDVRMTIRNCEFVNAHDLSVGGQDVAFHHNWVDNLDDEGVALPGGQTTDVRVHENVITATLDPLSFAVTRSDGPFYIYRNLVDVRAPTAGFRPRHPGDTEVWRNGNPFKDSASADTEYSVFQNTFLVHGAQSQATYTHYSGQQPATNARRFFNNIFVAVNPTAEDDRALAFLPTPDANAETDGNDFHKIGHADAPLLRHLAYGDAPSGTFDCLSGCDDAFIGSELFLDSMAQYPPGYEARSIDLDPEFIQIAADGAVSDTDDLRLGEGSPARAAGVELPTDLQALDGEIVPPSSTPDIGAYPFGAAPLAVGVDGRRSYPQ